MCCVWERDVTEHWEKLQKYCSGVNHLLNSKHKPWPFRIHFYVLFFLCSLLYETLLWQEVGLDDPQRSLPTPNTL